MAVIDFSDIVARVREELQISTSDTTLVSRIENEVNNVYENEVVPFKRWKWLEGHTDVVHKAYYYAGTCSVTPNSATVTLSTAPGSSQGSFAGYLFSVDGFDEIYEVSSHASESTTVTLTSTYQGSAANSTASFKIWRDTINLPTDCRETVEVWHNRSGSNMQSKGRQEIRQIATRSPKSEGFPAFYSTGDFYDPSGGDETESDRYRQARIYPSLVNENVTIHIDYVKEVSTLVDDTDEPLMPREDRMVLVYGTLAKLWASIRRSDVDAARNQGLYDRKLSQMAGRIEDSFDTPKLRPSLGYVRAQRSRLSTRGFRGEASSASGYSPVTYLEDVTINGASVTGNVTVSSGITIDGRDLSADGAILDALADNSETVEYRTISSAENTAKQLTLTATPSSASKVMVDVIQGSAQEYSVDYTVSGTTLSWSGLGLDGVITTGDRLRIHYWV